MLKCPLLLTPLPPATYYKGKGSDWIRLEFAHLFPWNSGAPIASANFISDGKVQVSPYGVASSCILMKEPAQLMGAPLFKTNRWAQSSPYPAWMNGFTTVTQYQ